MINREPYPAPASRLRVVHTNDYPIPTREQWEERVFRSASHFNICRFTSHNGSSICTVKTFPEALYITHEGANDHDRRLIYAVNDIGEGFCISPKEYEKFAQITLDLRSGK